MLDVAITLPGLGESARYAFVGNGGNQALAPVRLVAKAATAGGDTVLRLISGP